MLPISIPFKYFFRFALLAGLLLGACQQLDRPIHRQPISSLNIQSVAEINSRERAQMILSELEQAEKSGHIRRRGGSSIGFPKHSYELDLDQDASLAGLPADDDWILNANYIDKTFLRHVLAYDLFREMDPDNRAARCRFVELEMNGQYQGLYVLMEKVDRSTLDIRRQDPTAFIFKEPHLFRKDYEGIRPQKAGNFHQQTYPKIKTVDYTTQLEDIRSFLLSSDAPSFQLHFAELFDLDNILDWHLLLLITNNSDGILKNFYLYKASAEVPIRIAPWDYDHSFGRDGDNELNLIRPLDPTRSVLFARLLESPWYRKFLRQRWQQHTESGLLDPKNLKSRIREMAGYIKRKARRNFQRWPVNASWYYDANDFDAEIDLMLQYVDLRYQQLDIYFEHLFKL